MEILGNDLGAKRAKKGKMIFIAKNVTLNVVKNIAGIDILTQQNITRKYLLMI